MKPWRHIVMFSGGVCSWMAAMRVIECYGLNSVVLLFADTIIEDDDLYRFLIEVISNFSGAPIKLSNFSLPPLSRMDDRKAALKHLRKETMDSFPHLSWISDGRTPWDVMRDHRMIAKPRVDMCSRELKRDILDDWRDENGEATTTTVYVGIDWSEAHRYNREPGTRGPKDKGGLKQRMAEIGWRYEAPMTEAPYMQKAEMIQSLESEGIKPPRLYAMGFPHNNCGGFCVKAGQAHFAHLLLTMPERYKWHEDQEEGLRAIVGDYSVLRDRTGGTTKTLTLRSLRERIEKQGEFDAFEWGGCGCAIE